MSGLSRKHLDIFLLCIRSTSGHFPLRPWLVEKIPAKLCPAMPLLHKFSYFGTAFFEVLLPRSRKLSKDITDIVIYHLLWKKSWICVLVSDITTESKRTAQKRHWFINRIKMKCSDMFSTIKARETTSLPFTYLMVSFSNSFINSDWHVVAVRLYRKHFHHESSFPPFQSGELWVLSPQAMSAVPPSLQLHWSTGGVFYILYLNSWDFLHLE